MSTVIRIAAAVILDAERRMLVVRKRGTTSFMQPGGKLEPGESGAECLVRELEEELAIRVGLGDLEPVGRFSAVAANEDGHTVDCDVFRVAHQGAITVQAELDEARWLSRDELLALAEAGLLAPLTADHLDEFLG